MTKKKKRKKDLFADPPIEQPHRCLDSFGTHYFVSTLSPDLIYALRRSMRHKSRTFFNTPEKFLLMSVLNRAVKDLFGDFEDPTVEQGITIRDAADFFLSRDQSFLYSFKYICHWLDIHSYEFIEALFERLRNSGPSELD